jgi:hypothetical protein
VIREELVATLVSAATVKRDMLSVDALVDLRLDFDDEWRMAGVSNDSRGRVSSMDVYRPIDGR